MNKTIVTRGHVNCGVQPRVTVFDLPCNKKETFMKGKVSLVFATKFKIPLYITAGV